MCPEVGQAMSTLANKHHDVFSSKRTHSHSHSLPCEAECECVRTQNDFLEWEIFHPVPVQNEWEWLVEVSESKSFRCL